MQTFLKKLLALTAAICLIFGLVPADVQAQEDSWGTYVALGDSITTGYGLTGSDAYPSIVAASLGITLTTLAEDGETSQSLLNKLPDLSADIAKADVITITVGGNDLMNALYDYLAGKLGISADAVKYALMKGDTTVIASAMTFIGGFPESEEATIALKTFTTNAAKIIAAIRGINTHACIIVPNQYNPYGHLKTQAEQLPIPLPTIKEHLLSQIGTISDTFDKGVSELNKIYASLSLLPGCYVADTYNAFNEAGTNPCNSSVSMDMSTMSMKFNLDFHPNAEGHKLIAAAVASAISEAKGTMDTLLAANAAAVAQTLTLSADGKTITDEAAAQKWAEAQVTAALSGGVSADVQVTDFKAAQAGTKDNTAGTDGSMTVSVILNYYGYPLAQPVSASVQIKAVAYVAPEEDPDTDKPETTPEKDTDKNTAPENSQKNPSVKPVSTDNEETKSPQTGDSALVLFYALLVLAAGVCIPVAIKRKSNHR